MAWSGAATGGARGARLAFGLLAGLAPGLATAQSITPECRIALSELDRGFAASMARLLAASSPGEQCIALDAQINAVAKAVETQRRCREPGRDLDRLVAVLRASGDTFRQAQAQLGCSVPA